MRHATANTASVRRRLIFARPVQPVTEHRCDYRGCIQPADNRVGVAWLCLEHFLRDRVRLNLARLS